MGDQSDFDVIFEALQAARARYLVVGGVAVVLHGLPRFTADLDLVIALEHSNALAAMTALGTLGYRPRAPVQASDFADPELRRSWIVDKGLVVSRSGARPILLPRSTCSSRSHSHSMTRMHEL